MRLADKIMLQFRKIFLIFGGDALPHLGHSARTASGIRTSRRAQAFGQNRSLLLQVRQKFPERTLSR